METDLVIEDDVSIKLIVHFLLLYWQTVDVAKDHQKNGAK